MIKKIFVIYLCLLTAVLGVGFIFNYNNEDTVEVYIHDRSNESTFNTQKSFSFINYSTDSYLLNIEGLCEVDDTDDFRLVVSCEVDRGVYKHHYLRLSDEVDYFVEYRDLDYTNPYYYKIVYSPDSLSPDIELYTNDID